MPEETECSKLRDNIIFVCIILCTPLLNAPTSNQLTDASGHSRPKTSVAAFTRVEVLVSPGLINLHGATVAFLVDKLENWATVQHE